MKVPHESPTLTKHLPPPPRQGCPPRLSSSALCQPCPRFLPSTVAVCSRLHQSSAASSATSHRPTAASLVQHPSHRALTPLTALAPGARGADSPVGEGTSRKTASPHCHRSPQKIQQGPLHCPCSAGDTPRTAASHCCNPSIGDFGAINSLLSSQLCSTSQPTKSQQDCAHTRPSQQPTGLGNKLCQGNATEQALLKVAAASAFLFSIKAAFFIFCNSFSPFGIFIKRPIGKKNPQQSQSGSYKQPDTWQ